MQNPRVPVRLYHRYIYACSLSSYSKYNGPRLQRCYCIFPQILKHFKVNFDISYILSTVGDSYRNQNDALSTFAVKVNVVNRGCVFSVKQDKMECDDETASIFALRHY